LEPSDPNNEPALEDSGAEDNEEGEDNDDGEDSDGFSQIKTLIERK
jgi:hypothetical protein